MNEEQDTTGKRRSYTTRNPCPICKSTARKKNRPCRGCQLDVLSALCSNTPSDARHGHGDGLYLHAVPDSLRSNVDLWGPLLDLDKPAVPTFPIEALPNYLAEYVPHVAASTQTPPDFAAMQGLAVLSRVLVRKASVEINDDWRTPLALYLLTGGSSGDGRSPAHEKMVAPLTRLQLEWHDAAEAEDLKLAPLRAAYKAREKLLSQKAAKAKATEEMQAAVEELRKLQGEMTEYEEEGAPLIAVTTDFTMPALTVAMQVPIRRETIAVLSDEARQLFQVISGFYTGGESNADLLIAGWSGSPVSVLRVRRGESTLRAPLIVLGIMVQEGLFTQVTNPRAALRECGLLPRFLFSMPKRVSRVGAPVEMPLGAAEEYEEAVRKLWRIVVTPPPALRLSDEAFKEWLQWKDDLERRREEGGDLEHLGDVIPKLCTNAARLSGLIQVADIGMTPDEVNAESMSKALKLADYFLSHAEAALVAMGVDPVTTSAWKLLRKIRREGKETITQETLWSGTKGKRGAIQKIEDLHDGIAKLVDHNYVRVAQNVMPRAYLVNPKALKHPMEAPAPAGGSQRRRKHRTGALALC